MRLATVQNMRQSIDMKRATWVDAVDISTDEFQGVWTVHGVIDEVLPQLPIPVRVTFGTGYLTRTSGNPPCWLEEYVGKEFAVSGVGKATTISMGPSFRIDRDARGRLAMLTRVRHADQSADLYHNISPIFTQKLANT
jgi:hypothetical protein